MKMLTSTLYVMARQVRRKGGSKDATIDHDEESKKRVKTKHGRAEMRTVHRTAKRFNPDDEEVEEEEFNDIVKEEIDEEEDEDTEKDGDFDDSGKAYNALLTLLKSEHPESRKPLKQDSSIPEKHEDDEVAGVNVEKEEAGENDIEEEIDDDEDESSNGNSMDKDPFEIHFNQVSDTYITKQEKLVVKDAGKWTIEDRQNLVSLGYTNMTQAPPGEQMHIPQPIKSSSMADYPIKKRILDAFEKHYPQDFKELNGFDQELIGPMLNYKDISFPHKFKNTTYRKLYALHALNHVFKTRDRVIKNSTKLHSFREAVKEGSKDKDEEEPEFRDQGFTRPKILILLPTRNACYELVELLIKLSGAEQQENKKKFNHQFYANEAPPENKPEDFRETFKGNNNDFFCIGLKFTRKTLKLYSSFYSSDIIIASPIGISMILENPDKKRRQYDFISSIEMLIIDRANQIEMQNWDHVLTVMKYINKIPKDFHDADFSRIRMWSINDQGRLLRQNLIFCEYLTPSITNLISSKSQNLGGKVRFKPLINSSNCVMNSIGLKLKQIFQRFESPSPMLDPDLRFKFFINTILPSLTKSTSYSDGIMIFIPSYYDYLRIKHYMKTSTKFTIGSIDEYSSQSKLSKTRQNFMVGKTKILLYTERLHYFRRFEISGVKTLLMYGLPSNPTFYKELVRFIGKSVFKEVADLDLVFVKILFSKWDAVSLERIVGYERAPVLCNSTNELYEFR